MNKLDETIANIAYILDTLMAYRKIVNSGDCNNCKGNCGYMPKYGEQVRYNCPFYEKIEEKE